jgi:hypothetical protein
MGALTLYAAFKEVGRSIHMTATLAVVIWYMCTQLSYRRPSLPIYFTPPALIVQRLVMAYGDDLIRRGYGMKEVIRLLNHVVINGK